MDNTVRNGSPHGRSIQTDTVGQLTHNQPMLGTNVIREIPLPITERPQAHDRFNTVEQVTAALREAGFESSNLIVGIDFTKSNEWTGRQSFNGQSLHVIGSIRNPYEQAISIIGCALSHFKGNLIHCFGFGDANTRDWNVFRLFEGHQPCHGVEEALERYREIVPHISLAAPTSYAPVIEAAMDIVETSGGQHHVLISIADGQVTRSSDAQPDQLSPEEQNTVDVIVAASQYALSIIVVGVGDGPWETMQQFTDDIPRREFDNFQFVNFTKIMSRNLDPSEKEEAFALAALSKVPLQYEETIKLKILGRQVGNSPNIVPLPSPLQYFEIPEENDEPETSVYNQRKVCRICMRRRKDMAFGCGHLTCRACSPNLSSCPYCREPITLRLRLYDN